MRKDLHEWWHSHIPQIGMTPWEFMQRMGDSSFKVESYVTDSYAEPIRGPRRSGLKDGVLPGERP